jgi:succinyl-CoA synthetase beta subunit
LVIHEYQAKQILQAYGIPVPGGEVAETAEAAGAVAGRLGKKVVVKAQVHVGGRGKAGGIKVADTPSDAAAAAGQILGMNLKGLTVRKVLVEEALAIRKEFYLGFTLDRGTQRHVLMFSPMGGVDIEEVARTSPEMIFKTQIHPLAGLADHQLRDISFRIELDGGSRKSLIGIMRKLYEVYIGKDCSLAEINPLVLLEDGTFLAADGKINLDDNSLCRHPDLGALREIAEEDPIEREAHRRGLAYVRLDGNVGIIGNGAGLVMCTMDVVRLSGGRPANFLDIGGGARAEVVKQSMEIVLSDPNVQGLFINIFGGITRCDEVARGVIDAAKDLSLKVPMVIRLVGTREAEGKALLKQAGYSPVDTMDEGARLIVEQIAAR